MKEKTNLNFKKWIQWLLDFVQMDLKALSPLKRKNLFAEIAYFGSEKYLKMDWDEFEQSIEQLSQEDYKVLFEANDKGELDLLKIQKNTGEFLDKMDSIQKSRRKDRLVERILVTYLPRWVSYITSPYQGAFEIIRHPTKETPENWLILNFLRLIEGLETYPVRRCKGCSRYFLHLTKIKKLYCTSSCASRSIQRMKRDKLREDPKKWQAFLRESKKYQRKRYKESMRAKLGPKVKVGRKED